MASADHHNALVFSELEYINLICFFYSFFFDAGAKAPVDRVIERIVPSRISMTLFIVISVFAIIGIAIAFVFLAMNIKYRNQR